MIPAVQLVTQFLGAAAATFSAAGNILHTLQNRPQTEPASLEKQLAEAGESKEAFRKRAQISLGSAFDFVHNYNYAFVGHTRMGKSSLINALRGLKDTDKGAAPVGLVETHIPDGAAAYSWKFEHLKLFDMEGAGIPRNPSATYYHDKCLGAFDALVLVTDTITEGDVAVCKSALEFQQPVLVVRSRCDDVLKSRCRQDPVACPTMAAAAEELRRVFSDNVNSTLHAAGVGDHVPSTNIFLLSSHFLLDSLVPSGQQNVYMRPVPIVIREKRKWWKPWQPGKTVVRQGLDESLAAGLDEQRFIQAVLVAPQVRATQAGMTPNQIRAMERAGRANGSPIVGPATVVIGEEGLLDEPATEQGRALQATAQAGIRNTLTVAPSAESLQEVARQGTQLVRSLSDVR